MSLDIQNNKYVDIAKRAVVTGAIGACVSVPINYFAQKTMLKHSSFWIDKFEKSIADTKNQKHINIYKDTVEYLKKGKISYKSIGKTALYTGLFCACFSCVYNLIKSLYIRDERIFI